VLNKKLAYNNSITGIGTKRRNSILPYNQHTIGIFMTVARSDVLLYFMLYVSWGHKNILGPGPLKAALIHRTRHQVYTSYTDERRNSNKHVMMVLSVYFQNSLRITLS